MTDRANTVNSTMTMTVRSDVEVVFTRVFDAPRDLVFKVYTDPQLIPKWWGPRNLTTTVETMELRPEGAWRFVQRDAAGNEYGFHGINREIVPPERFVSTFEFEGMPGRIVINTATFEEQDGKTKLTVIALFQTIEDRDGYLQGGMEDGAAEGYDRLAELLQNMATGVELVIERIFDAPRELVWKAWTEPEHLMRWWIPNGITMPFCEVDLRPGGVLHFCHRWPSGEVFWIRCVYREVHKPERLVFILGFSDEAGNPVERPGFAVETLVTVTFAEYDGKTKFTARHSGLIADQGEGEGWSQSLDHLAEYVKKL